MKCGVQNAGWRMRNNSTVAVTRNPFRAHSGFTLMELMMVVAIMGLVLAMGIPSFLSVAREGPLRKAVNDVVEICGHARAQAILSGSTTEVVFHPRAGTVDYGGGVSRGAVSSRVGLNPVKSTKFDHSVNVGLLIVNELDLTEPLNDVAKVRFFKDGTCDEMKMELDAHGEFRVITLEVTTSLASIEALN
jgi:prepilin-type N-terminal cleavage/methylation domain-containing protein